MPKAPLLDEQELRARLAERPKWTLGGRSIARTFTFEDFTEAVDFLARLVEPSNAQNHHPDVTIHWNEVTLTLWTHASGGLTERDFRLARAIDELAP